MKAVQFQHIPELGKNAYNLAFGDFDKLTGNIDYTVVSNNGDYKVILGTVAIIADNFVNSHPHAIIYVKGLSASRQRLYQIGISSAWLEIRERYDIWGKQNNKWVSFEKGGNYEEFLVFKKIS